jgi:mono/diheme cytochrome c family protein
VILVALVAALAGCNWEMRNDARLKPLEPSPVFDDGRSSRPLQPGTVARGQLREDDAFYTGMKDGQPVAEIPVPVDRPLLELGRQKFNVYCSVCHGADGAGGGMVVKRGFPAPPSYHIDRLRRVPIGHFFNVITNGYGVMFPHADRVTQRERWAIAAYIRTLQFSQYAKPADVPAAEMQKLQSTQQ